MWTVNMEKSHNPPTYIPVDYQHEAVLSFMWTVNMEKSRTDVPYGLLDLMVLKTLDSLGPLHGFGIARRIEQVASGSLRLNQGTVYPALNRLEQRGWIASEWGQSKANRRARYYSITQAGQRQLVKQAEQWLQTVEMIARLLEGES